MFRRMFFCACIMTFLFTVSVQAGYDRVAYWSGDYPTNWAARPVPADVRDALEIAGYRIVDAAELKIWMEGHIADRKLSVVVMCNDIFPDTVAETNTEDATVRKYLDAGGKVVFYSDIAFYNQGHADGTNTNWGDGGAVGILGFNSASGGWDSGNTVTFTEAGIEWGLTETWNSARPVALDAWENMTILATDDAGNATAWVAHYVPGDTFRGFVRIRDVGGMPNVDDLIRVAEYGSAPGLPADDYPADGAEDIPRDTVLTWIPGEFAGTHNVYFGDNFADVNAATSPTSAGQADNTFDPGRLDFGQAYYWRVDEVNATPDKTVYRGDVWSFTVEPYAIQIPGADIIVTASSSSNEFSLPDKTIDGSGLDDDNAHGIKTDAMWFTAMGDMDPWIQFEFDAVKKLNTMTVWNSNSSAEGFIGYGVKGVEIAYSTDGETWEVFADVADVNEFSRAPGLPTYNQPNVIALGGVAAKMVRLNIQSNFGGFMQAYSLSEVQIDVIPVAARTPDPASGATDILPNAVVSWRAGREAAQSTVYVSTDPNEVADGLAASASSNTNSIDLGSLDLQMGQTYYWRVDEVNNSEAVSTWAGPVWSFSTVTAVVVDDFESYGNDSPDRPFQAWLDGYGYSPDEHFPAGYGGNGTGAGIGHDIWSVASEHYAGDIMEKANTMLGSNQSMPFYYSNTGAVASQTERSFAPAQDWTVGGAQTLSIAFAGQAGNTGTLYVKINNTKLTYPHAASNIAMSAWQAWNINLTSMNVQNVTTLQIGVDGSAASGSILIDDIRLHAEAGQVITPADPGTNGLVAKFTFNSDTSDSSGNGHNGTVVGTDGTTIVNDPVRGQVLSLPGGDDQYVEVGAVGINGTMPRTIACWAKAANTEIPDYTLIFGFTGQADGTGGNGSHFNIGSLGGPGGVGAHCWGWEETMVSDDDALEWHHYAMTYDGTTIAYFANGVQMDSDGAKSNVQDLSISADRVHIGSRITSTFSFPGNVDDAVIYDRVLSAEEILFLADVTAPIDKPF